MEDPYAALACAVAAAALALLPQIVDILTTAVTGLWNVGAWLVHQGAHAANWVWHHLPGVDESDGGDTARQQAVQQVQQLIGQFNDVVARLQLAGALFQLQQTLTALQDLIDSQGSGDGSVAPAVSPLPGAAAGAAVAAPAYLATEAQGGAFEDLTTNGMVRHHVPSRFSYRKDRCSRDPERGPAIRMTPEDHYDNGSYGPPGSSAGQYREDQADLMANDDPWRAFRMDIDDIHFNRGYGKEV